jgi:hypothetical protein
MLKGLSRLLAGEYGITGLLLGGLLVLFGLVILLATIYLHKSRKKNGEKGDNPNSKF